MLKKIITERRCIMKYLFEKLSVYMIMTIVLAIMTVQVSGETLFKDTSQHPLNVTIPDTLISIGKNEVIRFYLDGSKESIKDWIKRKELMDAQELDRFMGLDISSMKRYVKKRLRVCGGLRRYQIKDTPYTFKDSTKVSKFIEWRDSSYNLILCFNGKICYSKGYSLISGKWLSHKGLITEDHIREMKEVLKAWPYSEGYNTIFAKITFSRSTKDWFFHVPEVDEYNFTRIRTEEDVDYKNLQYSKPLLKNDLFKAYTKKNNAGRKMMIYRIAGDSLKEQEQWKKLEKLGKIEKTIRERKRREGDYEFK